MSEYTNENDELLDLEETPSAEELQDQVQRAQSELVELRRRQEQIEKEKQRLEDLTRRQEELERGRNEMADKLTRAIILVQRETEEAQRRLEQLNNIQDAFAEHLRNLEGIDPKTWNGRDLPRELTRSLGTVDEARSVYARFHAKIAPGADIDPWSMDSMEAERSRSRKFCIPSSEALIFLRRRSDSLMRKVVAERLASSF